MKVIVVGSRTFNDYNLFRKKLYKFLFTAKQITIITKGSKSTIARMADLWTFKHMVSLMRFYNDKKKNCDLEIINEADAMIAFWDGNSPGTEKFIDLAETYKLKVRIVEV